MVHGKNRIPYWIDRRLTGLAGSHDDATISLGLPIEPEDSQYGKYRVKGHAATGDVTLHYTEWQMAHRMRGEFFIYEVNHALTEPELWITQDPVGKGIEATERVVEYHIKSDELRSVAQPAYE